MTVHGSEGKILTGKPKNISTRLVRICVKHAASQADRIVTISTALADALSCYSRKLSVILNGVNADLVKSAALSSTRGTERIDELKAKGYLCLVFPGRLSARKGQDIMLKALGQLLARGLRVHLFLAGTGEDLLGLRALAEKLGLADQVTFMGSLSWDKHLALMAKSELIVTHLVDQDSFEGLSQVHLEAAVLKRPVVTAARRDLDPFRRSFFTTATPDPEEVANVVQYALEHPRETEERASRSSAIAESQFGWTSVADRYLEIYTR
jgi:glycosyltransferase involved in cell wall biosynthesis